VAVDATHRDVVRLIVRVVRDEGLVERANEAHLRDGPQLAAREVPGAAGPAYLNGAKDLVARPREAVAVRGDDARVSVVTEGE
jgi:hypothetical protein